MNSDSMLSSSNHNQEMNETENNIRNLQLTTNTDSDLNIIQTTTSHHEQNQSTNNNSLSVSSTDTGTDTSSSGNNMIPSSTVFLSDTNSMLDSANPWIRQKSDDEHECVRTSYTSYQLSELEKEFNHTKYLTCHRRIEVAHHLALTEQQIKIWFQYR